MLAVIDFAERTRLPQQPCTHPTQAAQTHHAVSECYSLATITQGQCVQCICLAVVYIAAKGCRI